MNDYESTPHRSNKNTLKWCKGKPGVEHDWQWISWADYKKQSYLADWEMQVCTQCNKNKGWRRAEGASSILP